VTFRKLTIDECGRISEIDASQYIKNAWREVDGVRQLVFIDWYEEGLPNGYENHLANLKRTFDRGGAVFGAFEGERLIAYCSVNKPLFGVRFKYALLDQLFISKEYRRCGIGKALMQMCADEARSWKAEKLYICAASAEETLAFYFAIGCIEALEVNEELLALDPRDYQLEYDCRGCQSTLNE